MPKQSKSKGIVFIPSPFDLWVMIPILMALLTIILCLIIPQVQFEDYVDYDQKGIAAP